MGGYLDRMAAKARSTDAFAALEEPKTIVWIVIAWTWGSAVNGGVIATIFFAFDEPAVGWAATALGLLFAACWFVFAFTGSVRSTFGLAIASAMAVDTYTHVVMGGYANSGGFFFWGVGVTVVAALALPRAMALAVGGYWVGVAVVFAFLEGSLSSAREAPNPDLPAVMFAYTMVLMTLMLVPVVAYLLARLRTERRRAEDLLLNVLPASIARRLKESPEVIADDFEECTVLFADIVGFTAHSRAIPADALIAQLNAVFSAFDELTERRGVQKIKTIGDGYMAVAGVPEPREDHIEACCHLALDMQEAMLQLARSGPALELRIGINTGPAVAGVIGTSRFSYDLWGDTVNMASRMESYGEPGKIQVSQRVVDRASAAFRFERAGQADLKGFGPTDAFYLIGANAG